MAVRRTTRAENRLEAGPMKAPMNPGSVNPAARKSEPRFGGRSLFDLGFLELDVLAHFRVVFLEAQLLGLSARVLLGHIEEARIGAADELDLDRCRLGHRMSPNLSKRKAAQAAACSGGSMKKGFDSVN